MGTKTQDNSPTRHWPAQEQAIENVEDILGLLKVSIEGYPYALCYLAVDAGVSVGTIYGVLNQKTRSPHLRTVIGMLIALGYKVEIRRSRKGSQGKLTIIAKAA